MVYILDIVEYAIEDLNEQLKDRNLTENDVSEAIHEIADSRVPVFYRALLEVAKNSIRLSCTEPEL